MAELAVIEAIHVGGVDQRHAVFQRRLNDGDAGRVVRTPADREVHPAEPDENIHRLNRGPLPDRELTRIYERLIDVMRKIQKEEIAPKAAAHDCGDTELEAEVND